MWRVRETEGVCDSEPAAIRTGLPVLMSHPFKRRVRRLRARGCELALCFCVRGCVFLCGNAWMYAFINAWMFGHVYVCVCVCVHVGSWWLVSELSKQFFRITKDQIENPAERWKQATALEKYYRSLTTLWVVELVQFPFTDFNCEFKCTANVLSRWPKSTQPISIPPVHWVNLRGIKRSLLISGNILHQTTSFLMLTVTVWVSGRHLCAYNIRFWT